MHINFEDENIIVFNLQIFLKENYDKHLQLSGIYDTYTHEALINYLKQPNTEDMRVVKSKIIEKFTYRDVNPPHSLVEGGGIFNFDNKVTNDRIHFYTKPVSKYFDNGAYFISAHIQELKDFVQTMGWTVTSYSQYAYNPNDSGLQRAEIIIDKTGINNIFPNKDVLPMINLFTGRYLYNKCFISSGNAFSNILQTNKDYKVAFIPCNPGDTFTVTHGYNIACEVAVGYSEHNLTEIKSDGYLVNQVENRLNSSVQGPVQPGDCIYYEIPEDSNATYLLVQMPYRSDLTTSGTEKVSVILGDVNQDGIVSEADYQLLDAYVTAKENNSPNSIELTGNALIAANVTRDLDLDGNPLIDRQDVIALQGLLSDPTSAPVVEYERPVKVSPYELDRLLIMYGEDARDESNNVPVDQFYIEPWIIHEKFIQYFLGRVIHKYSYMEDIAWLQTNLRNYNANYGYRFTGYYDTEDDYITQDKVVYDKISGRWKYYRGELYSGYYLDTTNDIQNCYIRKDDGTMSNMEVKKGRLYINGIFDNRVILSDGRVATPESEYCLKAIVKEFQINANKNSAYSGLENSGKLTWTIGYYDVDTDERFVKYMAQDITYDYGAFK